LPKIDNIQPMKIDNIQQMKIDNIQPMKIDNIQPMKIDNIQPMKKWIINVNKKKHTENQPKQLQIINFEYLLVSVHQISVQKKMLNICFKFKGKEIWNF